jgi:hypothetical protein
MVPLDKQKLDDEDEAIPMDQNLMKKCGFNMIGKRIDTEDCFLIKYYLFSVAFKYAQENLHGSKCMLKLIEIRMIVYDVQS